MPALLRAQLLLRRPALDADLFLLARDAIGRIAGRGHLQVEADDGLLLAVQFLLQEHDRGLGRSDRHVEIRNFFAHASQQGLFLLGALAQFLDLALGRQDAASFSTHTAFDSMRAAEHVTLERRDRTVRPLRRAVRILAAVDDPRVRNRSADRVRRRPGDTCDRRDRHSAIEPRRRRGWPAGGRR